MQIGGRSSLLFLCFVLPNLAGVAKIYMRLNNMQCKCIMQRDSPL